MLSLLKTAPLRLVWGLTILMLAPWIVNASSFSNSPSDTLQKAPDRIYSLLTQARILAEHEYTRALQLNNHKQAAQWALFLTQLEDLIEHIPASDTTHVASFPHHTPWLPPGKYDESGYQPLPEHAHSDLFHLEDIEFPDLPDLRISSPYTPPTPPTFIPSIYHPLPSIRYNRVEGLVLGIGSTPTHEDNYAKEEIYRLVGEIGYALAMKRWRYTLGAELSLIPHAPLDLYLGISYYNNTFTEDTWKMNPVENSLAAFFFHRDYYEYYQAQGWKTYIGTSPLPGLSVTLGFVNESHSPLSVHTQWSLFGRGTFRPNAPVTPGDLHAVITAIDFTSFQSPTHGIAFRATSEGTRGMNSDFSYNRFTSDLRLYLPIHSSSYLVMRSFNGIITGEAPPQKQFRIGGVGTLRAYPHHAFTGNLVSVTNLEWYWYKNHRNDNTQFFLLADIGNIHTDQYRTLPGALPDLFSFQDMRVNIGLGVALDKRNVRLEVAWPVNDPEYNQPVLWFRLLPSF